MRWFTLESLRILPVSLFTNTAMGTPQARWREITQSGLSAIMPRRRFCPAGGKNLVSSMAFSALSRRPWRRHGDEPLRRVAENDRLLGAPGMGIADGLALGRQQHARLFQSIHHAPVCIAPLAVLIDDAATFKAGRILGVIAIGVDGGRDRPANFFRPDIVVVGTMAGRGMNKARTSIVGDMIAIEERNGKIVTFGNQVDDHKSCQQGFGIGQSLIVFYPCPLSKLHQQACQQRQVCPQPSPNCPPATLVTS